MKIYISGKITGLPMEETKEKFLYHAQILTRKGYEAINPMEISPFEEGKEWHEYMVEDISELLLCEAIYMMEDWGHSRGARIEYQIAKELGLVVLFEGKFYE